MKPGAKIERVVAKAYRIPTEQPESDGTYRWESTTLVVVHAACEGVRGLGYSYADEAAAVLVRDKLAGAVIGKDPMHLPECWEAMTGALRNLGLPGVGMLAVSALDAALWDLKARLLELPLVDLLGAERPAVPVYGSGGFTSYTIEQLQKQLAGWVEQGIPRVKMKVGRDPGADPERVAQAREAIGVSAELMVDANGGYQRKEALALAQYYDELDVRWFEEPVDHRDRTGLRLLRDRIPAGMEVAVGEYGFTLDYFQRLLADGAVDVLQADATRCGVTGFLRAATLAELYRVPFSAHCAPALHLHLCCAAPNLRHLEYFHDHVRIERMLFDGVIGPVHGELAPDRTRPGMGLEFREEEARRYQV
ncbi:enolase C-terminal domain-like protein [Geomesophilobacter sediminis]|uniref:Mandelate racemase/muconate lactonizing enzyme C-terminal domain-containing protein n=1 Tax=Geomesophilobacter sediminis TaxID=2798584 RepID=A0A8J7M0N4_9BACT|nr:enolase C-terminal domain-like protein [Geomesophilobacter sediminis]MBJ6726102.1 hypothetical protein [Geomesophilobacter sediminis]